MEVVTNVMDLRQRVRQWHREGKRIALVPTMGNLHAGHIALVAAARSRAQRTVVSIFVNPSQFGPNEDFAHYPRTFDSDCRQLQDSDVDLVFAPSAADVYPGGLDGHCLIRFPELENTLCGAFRPGHFAGVATVVAKLFNFVQPHMAVFGLKDYQQLQIVKRMTQDLGFDIAIYSVTTVRETDGLALSSRNNYLSATERAIAPGVYGALNVAAQNLQEGDRDYASIEARGCERLAVAGFRVDYFAIRRANDLQRPRDSENDLVVLAAAWLGKTRLIDNVAVHNLR